VFIFKAILLILENQEYGLRDNNIKNVVFWDVAPCGSREKRYFGGTCRLHLQGRKIRKRRKMLAVC
jgi:hypothetical protein